MPLTTEILAAHIEKFGPYGYHQTIRTGKVLENGLQTQEDGNSSYLGNGGGWGGKVRSGHVYMRVPIGEPEFDDHLRRKHSIRIDLRTIDPARFDIDEDNAGVMGAVIEDRNRWPQMLEHPYKHPDTPGGFDYDQPEVVEYAMQKYGSVAVRGSLGLDHVEVNPEWESYKPEMDPVKTDINQEPNLDQILDQSISQVEHEQDLN